MLILILNIVLTLDNEEEEEAEAQENLNLDEEKARVISGIRAVIDRLRDTNQDGRGMFGVFYDDEDDNIDEEDSSLFEDDDDEASSFTESISASLSSDEEEEIADEMNDYEVDPMLVQMVMEQMGVSYGAARDALIACGSDIAQCICLLTSGEENNNQNEDA